MAASQPGGAPPNPGIDRFRSFAERYVVERARGFTNGKELEEAWRATQDAKKIYNMIEEASRPTYRIVPEPETEPAGGFTQGQASQPPMPRTPLEVVMDMKRRGLNVPPELLERVKQEARNAAMLTQASPITPPAPPHSWARPWNLHKSRRT